MRNDLKSLDTLLMEEESRQLVKARREIAAEEAAWNALSDEERAAALAQRQARWDAAAALLSDTEGDDE